ncbi:hypothetical protein [Reinekea sp.]|jgi:hypothetical protein|uniref:hypothetical protein n=1 Tax=Reinekea sp. TaxID=1970455 RepID=UPI002A83BA5E|nr:hypothetical protein [Reinekea sp.]
MNIDALLQAETHFFQRYPGGFAHPDLLVTLKKHRVEKMVAQTQEDFAQTSFVHTEEVLQNWIKIVGRSSMVSLFEKPKFKDCINSLSAQDKTLAGEGLYDQLHGDPELGLTTLVSLFARHKMAKWTLLSLVPAYYRPSVEVFIKPTTAKGVIAHFDLPGLVYHSRPSWLFYQAYRSELNAMKELVDINLSPNNAAFSGFLMMSLPKAQSVGQRGSSAAS